MFNITSNQTGVKALYGIVYPFLGNSKKINLNSASFHPCFHFFSFLHSDILLQIPLLLHVVSIVGNLVGVTSCVATLFSSG